VSVGELGDELEDWSRRGNRTLAAPDSIEDTNPQQRDEPQTEQQQQRQQQEVGIASKESGRTSGEQKETSISSQATNRRQSSLENIRRRQARAQEQQGEPRIARGRKVRGRTADYNNRADSPGPSTNDSTALVDDPSTNVDNDNQRTDFVSVGRHDFGTAGINRESPTAREIGEELNKGNIPDVFREKYQILADDHPLVQEFNPIANRVAKRLLGDTYDPTKVRFLLSADKNVNASIFMGAKPPIVMFNCGLF
jgi:hypothetical protein